MRLNALRAFATMALAFALAFPPLPAQASTDDLEVALGLATMLRSARTVMMVTPVANMPRAARNCWLSMPTLSPVRATHNAAMDADFTLTDLDLPHAPAGADNSDLPLVRHRCPSFELARL